MPEYLLDQWKMLASTFNDEITRFWTRFHIMIGLEMGGLVGILASSDILEPNSALFRTALLFMNCFAVGSAAIVWRGFLMHQTLLKALALVEEESGGKLRLLELCGRVSRIPIGLNQVIAIVIASSFAILWLAFLVYGESVGYQFNAHN